MCTQGPHSPLIPHNLHSDPLYYNLLPCRVIHSCSTDDDGRGATLSVGHLASPSSSLGRNRTPGLHQVPQISLANPQIFGSPKNSIIAENCLPGNDSTEWDVNADGDPSIQVATSAPRVLLSFQCLPGFCYKIQCSQRRSCPIQDQDRFFKLPTGYLPRRLV